MGYDRQPDYRDRTVKRRRRGRWGRGLGDLPARGALSGLFAGFVFLGGIFNNQTAPKPIEAGPFGLDNVVVGLATHITLSMLFGIAFALLAAMLLRRGGAAPPPPASSTDSRSTW